jgi:hypothetical protein
MVEKVILHGNQILLYLKETDLTYLLCVRSIQAVKQYEFEVCQSPYTWYSLFGEFACNYPRYSNCTLIATIDTIYA